MHNSFTPKMNHFNKERASSFTSKGSITLEAAVVIPLFFFAMLSIVYLFEILAIQTAVRTALHGTGKELMVETYIPFFVSTNEIEERLIEKIGKEKLDRSIIVDGSEGLDCVYSLINPITGVINLNVRYQMEIPVLVFRLPIRTYEERLRVKGWNGLVSEGGDSAEDDLVYVTESGVVYHKSLSCTYLELSVRSVPAGRVVIERNESGGVYYPCERCKEIVPGYSVYITDYGNRFHNSLNCSGLKRTINVVPLSEVNGLGGCSKCVY